MRRAIASTLAASVVLAGATARAWDPATTHAGLTEQAALASSLMKRLPSLHGISPWELLRGERLPAQLKERLARLDPAAGVAPEDARLPVLGWIVAGAVIEETPPQRGRHHFYDPSTGHGLTTGGALTRLGHRIDAAASGLGSAGGVLSGEDFDGTGRASTEWMVSPENDLGLPRFLDARERAVTATSPRERHSALIEALLAAGAIAHVIEDAGDPAHVHDDFDVDLYGHEAPLARYAAQRFGRQRLPAPAGPARTVPHLTALITAGDGSGLADRTARRFYSLGPLAPDGNPARWHLPPLHAGPAASGHARDGEHRILARWTRDDSGGVHWTLDERCYAEQAAALLPEAAQAALSAIEHLFRGSLVIGVDGVKNGDVALGAGRASLFAEADDGWRRVAATVQRSSVGAGESLIELPSSLGRAKRVAVVFRGVDAAGEPIVVSAELDGASLAR